LRGSERHTLKGAQSVGRINPAQAIEVSVLLRQRQPLALGENQGLRLNRDELRDRHGANAADIQLVGQFAAECGLQVLERSDQVERRTIVLTGTAAQMEAAFGVQLHDFEFEDGTYRGRTGTIEIPIELAHTIQGVFGLDDRPAAQPQFRIRSAAGAFGKRAQNLSYKPTAVGQLYQFPHANGAGQTIGILELGGGYRPADLEAYFKALNLRTPTVKAISVDHGKNRPTTAQSADGEVMLDIEIAGAIAPAAKIVVYFAPNTSQGFHDALSAAVHDRVNNPSVLSISWGGPESSWTEQSMIAFDQVAQEAAALGITITVASGDNGSNDGVLDGGLHVDFPASCPHVLAAGGTRLVAANGAFTSETVWNNGAQGGASGGGYSSIFERPAWQAAVVTQSFRGVPDVAADADPNTGYDVLVDGQSMVIGGTSAAAPLWAGLIALLNQSLGKQLGFINPELYSIDQSDGLRDITQGNNGAFSARPGWDAATGLGSPIGAKLLQTLQAKMGIVERALLRVPAWEEAKEEENATAASASNWL
jgi:kumamolisin